MSPTASLRLSLVLLVAAALAVAGCGGSSSSAGVAQLSSSTSSGSTSRGGSSRSEGAPTQQQMVAFSQCMRKNGVPEFPEPSEGKLVIHGSDRSGHVSGLNPNSPKVQAAQKVCSKLLPNGGTPSPAQVAQAQEQARKFSQCMRTHGVPNFPEPEFSQSGGGIGIKIGARRGAGGIDPNSPRFLSAQKACQSILPGPKGGGPAPAQAVG